MTTVVYGATGVGQLGRISNGIRTLCERLVPLPGLHVELVKHKANPLQAASRVANELQPDRIIGFGHSKGGLWVVEWCWELKEFGRIVDGIVLADAWDWKRNGPITIPSNVRYVESFTQCNSRIKGSKIDLEFSPVTRWVHHPDQAVNHAQVDGLPEFKAAVLKLARGASQ